MRVRAPQNAPQDIFNTARASPVGVGRNFLCSIYLFMPIAAVSFDLLVLMILTLVSLDVVLVV